MSNQIVADLLLKAGHTPEAEVTIPIVFATLSVVGVAFYLWFIVALCKERRYAWICYLLRMQPTAGEVSPIRPNRVPSRTARAA